MQSKNAQSKNPYIERGKRILQQLLPNYITNATRNFEQVREGLASGRITPLEDLGKVIHKPAIIFGSGVHGKEILRLRDLIQRENITVFSSPSNTNWLIAHGIMPKYCVSVDQQIDVAAQIETLHPCCENIPLLTTMVSNPSTIEKYPGKIYIFKPHQRDSDFIENILPKMYQHLEGKHRSDMFKIGILNMGCVTNTMFSLASYLGHDPLFLIGNDFCFAEDRYSLDRYHWKEKAEEEGLNDAPIPESAWEIQEETVIKSPEGIIYDDGIATNMEMSHYRLAFYILWKMNPMRMYTLSPETLLNLVPYLSPSELIQHYDKYTAPKGYPITSIQLTEILTKELHRLQGGGDNEKEDKTAPAVQREGGDSPEPDKGRAPASPGSPTDQEQARNEG